MRLPLQIALGQTFVILFPVALSVLGISLLTEVGRGVEQVTQENYRTIQDAHEVSRAIIRHEIARRDGYKEGLELERQHFEAAMQSFRGAVKSPEASALLSEVVREAEDFFAGQRPLEEMMDVVGAVVSLQEESLSGGSRGSLKSIQSGIGLVAVLGALGLCAALYFGYWLARNVGYPLERIVQGTEAIALGDLLRRVGEYSPTDLLARLSKAINQLADRVQRTESDRLLDYLLATAAVEKLLDARHSPAGLLTPGKRLVVANREARELLRQQDSSLDVVAAKLEPARVERTLLTGPDGAALGELLAIKPR